MRYAIRQLGKILGCTTLASSLLTLLFCYSLAAFTGSAHAQVVIPSAGDINTVAGNGTAGFSGDGGTATSAKLDAPIGVAVDTAGNIYIGDTTNNRIRKVTASTGVISTVAGNGTAGFSGDGAAATSAELSGPHGVAVDSAGNIYIADTNNNRIRKVTASTGNISTVAGNGTSGFSGDGGAATSAELAGPAFLAVNSSGNIYITDTSNTRVREVVASTGIISTAAGQSGTTVCGGATDIFGDGCGATNAVLDFPQGIAVDSAGNLYIADSGACEVRVVVASTSTISAVAGNPTCGFTGDGGLATTADLHSPFGVAVDASGNIYIADQSNNLIRATGAISAGPGGIGIPSSGDINTIAGDGTQGFSGDGWLATSAELLFPDGLAVDSSGNIYFADLRNHRIRKVTASTGIISTVAGNGTAGFSGDGGAATSAKLNYPRGVAVDTAGNIYIGDSSNNRIRKVTTSTGTISTVAGNGTAGFSGDGGAATSAELNNPGWVALDTSNNLYLTDNGRIRKVTASTGKISTVAGNGTAGFSGDGGAATSAEMSNPISVALDTSGNIYISDWGNLRVRKVTVSTGKISTVAGNGTVGSSGDGGAATSAGILYPYGVALDTAGNIYIADWRGNRIRKVTVSTGIISTVVGNGCGAGISGTGCFGGDGGSATSAELWNPTGVTLDAAGNIYISDTVNDRIRAVGH